MVGLPTRLLVADMVLKELSAEEPGNDIYSNKSLRPWFMFGAIGGAIGDFVPNEVSAPNTQGRTGYYQLWQQILSIAVGNPTLDPPLPGLVPTLSTLEQALATLTKLVANHDFNGMLAFKDSPTGLAAVDGATKDLATILKHFTDIDTLANFGKLIGTAQEPKINKGSQLYPPNMWTGREWLHWKRPGTFAGELMAQARRTEDPRFIAYAAGWQAGYATLVCGSGFATSAAGSSYRTYWWRNRWTDNFIDAWAWGFYLSGSTLDEREHFDYDNWPSLCNAKLHDWIDVTATTQDPMALASLVVQDSGPLPQLLPDDFTQFWINAWTAAYQPQGDPLFTAERVQAGYLLTWLALWFQTSGDVIGCAPAPPGAPPAACGNNPQPPPWVVPGTNNPMTGEPFKPQTPSADLDPDVGETVCAVILAVLGIAAIVFGGYAVGAGLLAAGIGLGLDGVEQLDWDTWQCNLYWQGQYMVNGLTLCHELMVLGGFQYPYASDLAISQETTISYGTHSLSFMSAGTMCRSRVLKNLLVPWNGGQLPLASWTNYPTGATEAPVSAVWDLDGLWPSAFINDAASNPVVASIRTAPPAYNTGVNGSFGPAVQNAVALLRDPPETLPNWDLDGDRGLGWLTWQLTAPWQQPLLTEAES